MAQFNIIRMDGSRCCRSKNTYLVKMLLDKYIRQEHYDISEEDTSFAPELKHQERNGETAPQKSCKLIRGDTADEVLL